MENGDKKLVGKGFCELINLNNGCILITESHDISGICDSEWEGNNKLKTSDGVVDIPGESKIVSPEYIIDDYNYFGSFDYSIQGYLSCYPVNSSNRSDYLKVSDKLIKEWGREDEGEFLLQQLKD